MSLELKVTIQDTDKRKLTKEYLVYEPVTLTPQDPVINKYVKELLEEFKGEADDIKIRATMILR